MPEEASSEAAYALGVVGNADDLPLILREAERSRSMITRRRCLLGIARNNLEAVLGELHPRHAQTSHLESTNGSR